MNYLVKEKKVINKRRNTGSKKNKKPKTKRYYDIYLLIYIVLTVCFGLVMLFSASAYQSETRMGSSFRFLLKQFIYASGGIIAMIGVSFINYKFFSKFSGLLWLISIAAMFLVNTGLGYESHNARRWLKIGGITVQPSEIAKLAVILFLPWFITAIKIDIQTFKGTIIAFSLGAIPAIVAWKGTDNMSTAIIIAGIAWFMIGFSKPRPLKFFIFTFLAIVAIYVVGCFWAEHLIRIATSESVIKSFRNRRLLAWRAPYRFIQGVGWQVIQGLYAIGSGGFLGKGLGRSTQKLYNVPEAQNDFILPIIYEETGLFGAFIIMLLFIAILCRLTYIAFNVKDRYAVLVIVGIVLHISIQVIFNICVVLNLIPTTGVSLPFISSGGTALVMTLMEMGVALSISRSIILND